MKLAAASIVMALLLIALVTGLQPRAAMSADAAADPSATPTLPRLDDDVLAGGDPRSEGEGPGIVGSPLAILFGVVLLGLATAAVTALLVRLRIRRGDAAP